MSVPFDAIDPPADVDRGLDPMAWAKCPVCRTTIVYDPDAFEDAREAHSCGNCLELECECLCPLPGSEEIFD